ncbi:MAG: ribosome maturation factor RimM [Proteobacteria bacterium]|nr:ribosome maturation factor RimM [Pseudomonadota bacterium]MBU1737353.1 ribosome maturation factor RimM [Pseudomonadota bacterium]
MDLTAAGSGPDQKIYIQAGKISKPHGIKGELRVHPYSENPDDFSGYPEILVVSPGGEYSPYQVQSSSAHGKVAIVKISGVDDRNGAEELSGLEIWVDRRYLPELLPDEFFWHDLVGLDAVSESGLKLGRVKALFATGGHDVLVIRGTGREYLVPARREFMLDVDLDRRLLTIADVPGLFDM